MQISTFCRWYLHDEDTCSVLEGGDCVDKFSYMDDGHKVTLENVKINDISEDTVTIETEDWEEITVDVDDIVEWEE